MLALSLLFACSGPSDRSGPSSDGGPTGADPAAEHDPCDGSGEPEVVIGTLADSGAFTPWGDSATFASGPTLPVTTGPASTIEVGIAAPNLAVGGYSQVRLVATDGATVLFDSTIPAGFQCNRDSGPVGVLRVNYAWQAVAGHPVRFDASITDDGGRTTTGTATVVVSAP